MCYRLPSPQTRACYRLPSPSVRKSSQCICSHIYNYSIDLLHWFVYFNPWRLTAEIFSKILPGVDCVCVSISRTITDLFIRGFLSFCWCVISLPCCRASSCKYSDGDITAMVVFYIHMRTLNLPFIHFISDPTFFNFLHIVCFIFVIMLFWVVLLAELTVKCDKTWMP